MANRDNKKCVKIYNLLQEHYIGIPRCHLYALFVDDHLRHMNLKFQVLSLVVCLIRSAYRGIEWNPRWMHYMLQKLA